MNILSQQETNSIYGGNMFNKIAKKLEKTAQDLANEAIEAAANQAAKEINEFKIK